MATLSIPNSFVANTLIQSALVNANFTAIASWGNGNISNANISASAAIDVSKLAVGTANQALFTNSGATSVTWGTLPIAGGGTGQTSASAAFNALSPVTTTGDMIYSSTGTTTARLAIGSSGQYLRVSGGIPSWQSSASANLSVVTKTANYTATASDDIILCNTNAFTITLPAATTSSGKIYYIAKIGSDTNAISITRAGSDTIDGATTVTLNNQYDIITIGCDGSSIWYIIQYLKSPTQQTFTSGTGTYTTPAGVKRIRVKMVGGGAGGTASGTASQGAGGTGGVTTFGTTFLQCNGGAGAGGGNSNGGTGGTASIGAGAIGIALSGGNGTSGGGFNSAVSMYTAGGRGGDSPIFGGSGGGGAITTAGVSANANSGGGGGGGGANNNTSSSPGAGGGSGGVIDAWISSPAATYAYAVGTSGTAGTAGTNGFAGGTGGSGAIYVEEYFS